jgi:hypothetical protein
MMNIFRNTPLILALVILWISPLYSASYEAQIIPSDHKVKKSLDKLFKDRGYPKTKKDFMRMGFRNLTRPSSKGALVFKHRNCKGYLIKVYTNKKEAIDEARVFSNRISGAESIREYIHEHSYDIFFKVPKKWLYYHDNPSHYILVAEDMNILNHTENTKKWKSDKVTEPLLRALASTLKDLGLIDSMYIDNIPYCKDGKIAFIDTEHYHLNPVPLHILSNYLSKNNKQFWLSKIRD